MKEIVKHYELYNKTLFGFWVYLMTDCVLFATLFATYIVLHTENFGGPTTADLYSLPLAFCETMVLLFSSFTIGLARLEVWAAHRAKVLLWIVVTFILGASFIAMELHEFIDFVHEGNSWQRSAFLSSYFTLVATHGCHICFGLIWMVMLFILIAKNGLTEHNVRRAACLGLFWHFLDVVWIFIFSVVYLMGVLP